MFVHVVRPYSALSAYHRNYNTKTPSADVKPGAQREHYLCYMSHVPESAQDDHPTVTIAIDDCETGVIGPAHSILSRL